MAMGYEDKSAKINEFVAERASLEEFAIFKGFKSKL
jgi:hypothetical protein